MLTAASDRARRWNTSASALRKLVPVTGRRDSPYRVRIIDQPIVNAVTFPGGFIYFYQGILDQHLDEDMLAAVMGHELAHAVRSHSYRTMQAMEVLGTVTGGNSVSELGKIITVIGVGRTYENQADQFGMQYAAKAGLRSPQQTQRYADAQPPEPEPTLDWSDIPFCHAILPTSERIKRITAELKKLGC